MAYGARKSEHKQRIPTADWQLCARVCVCDRHVKLPDIILVPLITKWLHLHELLIFRALIIIYYGRWFLCCFVFLMNYIHYYTFVYGCYSYTAAVTSSYPNLWRRRNFHILLMLINMHCNFWKSNKQCAPFNLYSFRRRVSIYDVKQIYNGTKVSHCNLIGFVY